LEQQWGPVGAAQGVAVRNVLHCVGILKYLFLKVTSKYQFGCFIICYFFLSQETQTMCEVFILNGTCFCYIWLTITFFEAGYSHKILRREECCQCILLQISGSLNTKIPNETADWCLVTETLNIRTVGLK
jgi:hypothetical protein